MHVIVCSPWSRLVFIQTWPTSHSVTCPIYQVTEGSGYVTVTLLVIGQVSVEFTVVVDITGGIATGEMAASI